MTIVMVVHNFSNWYKRTYASLAYIVPLSAVKYKVVSRYHGGELANGFKTQGYSPLYLSAFRRGLVAESLRLQGFEPSDYIEPVTVHGEWKIRKHQGYCFAIHTWTWKTKRHIVTRDSAQTSQLLREILLPQGKSVIASESSSKPSP